MSCSPSQKFDLVIKNGTIYDGSGGAPVKNDIGIIANEIAKIGEIYPTEETKIIDAQGLAVSPGFIDLHSHLDPIMELPDAESHVRQGVTTALGGPDGGGPWPFGEFLDSLEKMPLGYNVGYLTGHNRIRRNVMDLENREPTTKELEEMKSQVNLAMEEGAFGISTGLKYLPGTFSKVDEVIELSKIAAMHGGIYTSHLREEGLGLIDGVSEAILIGREANIPIVLTHHKVVGQPMWGSSNRTLALVDSARNAGIDVMIDQYPYNASYTGISILIPGWALAGGQEEFEKRMTDKVLQDSIRSGTLFNIINDRGGNDLKRVQFAKVSWQPDLEGKTLYNWAAELGMEPSVETGADLVLQAQLNGGASAIFFAMHDDDVENIMSHEFTMIASDGRLVKLGDAHPHPRWYGTFPRVLGLYVREKQLMKLEEAIRKMTSLPAKRMGLDDRGLIKEGYVADITIFNPETVIDMATFEEPHQYPEGIDYVIINGKVVVDDAKFTESRPGLVLRGPAFELNK
ncbi:MAG: D-aminoacylase [Cyclobacteriaceae bacterium]